MAGIVPRWLPGCAQGRAVFPNRDPDLRHVFTVALDEDVGRSAAGP